MSQSLGVSKNASSPKANQPQDGVKSHERQAESTRTPKKRAGDPATPTSDANLVAGDGETITLKNGATVRMTKKLQRLARQAGLEAANSPR